MGRREFMVLLASVAARGVRAVSDLPNFGALLWVVSFWGATHPWLTTILL